MVRMLSKDDRMTHLQQGIANKLLLSDQFYEEHLLQNLTNNE